MTRRAFCRDVTIWIGLITPQKGANGAQHTGQVGQAVHIHTQAGDVPYLHSGALPGLQQEVNALSRGAFFLHF